MWSHYADNHKGFVIEYDTDALKTNCMLCPEHKSFQTCPNRKQVMLLPILYTEKRYDATNYIFENTIIQTFKNAGLPNIFQLSETLHNKKLIFISISAGLMKKNGDSNYLNLILKILLQ